MRGTTGYARLTQKNCTAIFCARNKEILLEFLVQEMHGISLNAKHFFARSIKRIN
jgi:hypothetical protein